MGITFFSSRTFKRRGSLRKCLHGLMWFPNTVYCKCYCIWQLSFCCVCLPLSMAEVIPAGLLIFVWVLQHSIKLVKYTQGYLSQPERLWTYTSPSNRCTDYGLQRAPEEWLKHPVRQAETRPSCNVLCAITFKKSAGWYTKNHLGVHFFLMTWIFIKFEHFYQY